MKAKESVINICDHMDVIAEAGDQSTVVLTLYKDEDTAEAFYLSKPQTKWLIKALKQARELAFN